MKVNLYKASPLRDEVSSVEIFIDREMPNFDLEEARKNYRIDAGWLVDALFSALPGGTIDQVLILMLERRASLLKVKL